MSMPLPPAAPALPVVAGTVATATTTTSAPLDESGYYLPASRAAVVAPLPAAAAAYPASFVTGSSDVAYSLPSSSTVVATSAAVPVATTIVSRPVSGAGGVVIGEQPLGRVVGVVAPATATATALPYVATTTTTYGPAALPVGSLYDAFHGRR
jgi:hypothetical protein